MGLEDRGSDRYGAKIDGEASAEPEPAKTNSDSSSVKISIANVSVSGIKKSYTYIGKKLTPAPSVKLSGKLLKKGTDYTLSYSANKKVGTAKLTIKGTGKYDGTKTVFFRITKAGNPLKIKVSSKKYSAGKQLSRKARSFAIGASKGKGKVKYVIN